MKFKPYLRLVAALFCSLLLMTACKENEQDNTSVQIRIENDSPQDFTTLQVSSGGDLVDYGSLAAGRKSEYKTFTSAYRYGYVVTTIKGQRVVCQPIDYVGETHLSPGKYTYKMSMSSTAGYLDLDFRKD